MKWVSYGTLAGIVPFVLIYVLPWLAGVRVSFAMQASMLFLGLIPLCFAYADPPIPAAGCRDDRAPQRRLSGRQLASARRYTWSSSWCWEDGCNRSLQTPTS